MTSMPPLLAAHLDLELALDVFTRAIADSYTAAKTDYDIARLSYLDAGGNILPDEHLAVVAYMAAELELTRWARIEEECMRISVPKSGELGLSVIGQVAA